jgi:hypothetical protein
MVPMKPMNPFCSTPAAMNATPLANNKTTDNPNAAYPLVGLIIFSILYDSLMISQRYHSGI